VAPGVIRETNLHHHLTEEHFKVLRSRQPGVRDLPRKSLAQGAATVVWALTDPLLVTEGGRFLEDCGFSQVNQAWGIAGASTEIRNISAGALIEPLTAAEYPNDVVPI
jgi:hypothetical protein